MPCSDKMNVPTSNLSVAQNWPLPLCVSILRGPALGWDGCDGLVSSGKFTRNSNFHVFLPSESMKIYELSHAAGLVSCWSADFVGLASPRDKTWKDMHSGEIDNSLLNLWGKNKSESTIWKTNNTKRKWAKVLCIFVSCFLFVSFSLEAQWSSNPHREKKQAKKQKQIAPECFA